MLSCTEPGDEVLLPTPAYASYQGAVGMARCLVRSVPLNKRLTTSIFTSTHSNAPLPAAHQSDSIRQSKAVTDRRALVGSRIVVHVMGVALRHNLTVILDEVYKDFYYTDDKRPFAPRESPRRETTSYVSALFSKAYSMTG